MWKSLNALRNIAGSFASSDVYSDQCGQGDGMVGERFMKRFLDSVSMVSGWSRVASGIASRMFEFLVLVA